MAQDSEMKAVTNPAALYYSGYYPGAGQYVNSVDTQVSLRIFSGGYYPGFRGYQPGYYNPYAGFGYLGYNGYNGYNNFPARSLLTRPLAFRPAAVPARVPATEDEASLTQGTQFHFQDQMGNINYGYSNINSAKQEVSVSLVSGLLTCDDDRSGMPTLGSPVSTPMLTPMVSSSWSPMWRMTMASGSSLTPDWRPPPTS